MAPAPDQQADILTLGDSIALLRRSGWTRDTLKPVDTVTVRGNPSRAGTPFMVVQEVTINGKSYLRDVPQQSAAAQ